MLKKEVILILKDFGENGFKKALLEKGIDEKTFKRLCLLGLIKQGSDGEHQTVQVTEFGFKQIELYREPSLEEAEWGRFYASLGV